MFTLSPFRMPPIRRSPVQSGVALFLSACGLTSLLLLPELWLAWSTGFKFAPSVDSGVLSVFFLLTLLICLCKSRVLAYTVLLILYLLQLTQFLHFSYFGSFYGPAQVILGLEEIPEISESALSAPTQLLPPLLAAGTGLLLALLLLRKVRPGLPHHYTAGVLLLIALCLPLIKALDAERSTKFEPDAQTLAIRNGLYSVSYFLAKDLPALLSGDYQSRDYQPYQVSTISPHSAGHVILILGESTSLNHLHLYGYPRPTTPHLDALATQPQFSLRAGIAAAVTTRVAVPMLLNVQREPDNLKHLRSSETALFHLAKRAGYQTVFVSTQIMDRMSSYLSPKDIDLWLEQEQLADLPGRLDHKLLSAIDGLPVDWSKPVFMVINPRCCHSPYEVFTPSSGSVFAAGMKKSSRGYRAAAYDDAILYLDELLSDLIQHVVKRKQQAQVALPVTFMMLSDHGEKLGEDHQFGHNHLDMTTAQTPFFIYSPDTAHYPPEVSQTLQSYPQVMPHYIGSKLLANLLGYKITNPNETAPTFYINGVDIAGRAGFISYDIGSLQQQYASRCSSWAHGCPGVPQPTTPATVKPSTRLASLESEVRPQARSQ